MTDIVRMYDGIAGDAASIAKAFPGATMVAGYVDGQFVWQQSDWNMFPKAQHILVSAIPGSSTAMTADVADCEDGDYDAAQAASWARAKIKAGYYRPTIYTSLDNAQAVRDATGSLILGVDYDLWIADYDGLPKQVVFSDGRKAALKQYNDFNFYDISAVFDDAWPHRKAPKPVNHGPVRHVAPNGNTYSLEGLAAHNGSTEDHYIQVSEANMDQKNLVLFRAYLTFDAACVAAGINHATMPTGFVYYTES